MLRSIATVTSLIVLTAASIFAQGPPDARPSFHTVSIQPSDSGHIAIEFSYRSFTARASTLCELIESAYGIQDFEVFDGPDWVRTDRFSIRATTPYVGLDEMKRMLQRLLAERFELQLEPDTVTTMIYRLRAGTIHHLTPAAMPYESSAIRLKRDDYDADQRWDARRVTMDRLAAELSRYLGAPVVDETRLTGAFNFRVQFTQNDALARRRSDPNSRTLFNALEKQLGLTLVADTSQVSGYVIRRAAKPR